MTPLAETPALYAGFGCRKGCPVETLHALLHSTLHAYGLPLAAVQGIASLALKADEPGLQCLAERLELPLVLFDAASVQPFAAQLSHHSPAAFAHSGCWGVAESTALALAQRSHSQARLRVPRQVLGPATLALAIGG
ncbi:cobalamin biosynthesis protein [Pseudomonas entomophila]|uniref:cobalamin biosynthesis protein n=1 Tax=Pseudomonas entomophila TaxID=312306 RepID=UPI0023D7E3A1|nr:cobalamin biosynthesis protein [Pseudomonas entomophila]MDF0731730.1 cobalamin biosynthesis protein [Pseudomonas entomophila]